MTGETGRKSAEQKVSETAIRQGLAQPKSNWEVIRMRKNSEYDFYENEDQEVENEYLTPREVMNYLYIGKNLFYKLVNSGELPAFRIGRLWRVSRSVLIDYGKRREKGQK